METENKAQINDQEKQDKPKKKYYYGDKYKGRYKGKYKDTIHQNYLKKKENMTDEEKQKLKEYHQEHYKKNKDKYLERSKTQNEKLKEAVKLYRNVEKGIIIPIVNKDKLQITA